MKLIVKKGFSLLLTAVTMFSTLYVAEAYDSHSSFVVAGTNAAFAALPDDAVVCYVMGTPVYKSEIDENGYIHKDFSDNTISTCSSDSVQSRQVY